VGLKTSAMTRVSFLQIVFHEPNNNASNSQGVSKVRRRFLYCIQAQRAGHMPALRALRPFVRDVNGSFGVDRLVKWISQSLDRGRIDLLSCCRRIRGFGNDEKFDAVPMALIFWN
jgi:hypothetical protein